MQPVILSKTSVIEKWAAYNDYGWLIKKFGKSVVMTVCGKETLKETPDSRILVFFIKNDTHIFRMVIWKNVIEMLEKNGVEIKLNKTYRITELNTDSLFKGRQDYDDPPWMSDSSLFTSFQLVAGKDSKFIEKEDGVFEEYPSENRFPPIWKNFKEIGIGDIELG